ncbi:uncharacterized protein METZ01_LOCUS82543 [marine metagenome]|uniref:Uncharacterized protein n=1 Tax=marine metagenome TaxID=408172 RepID=A0A381UNG2_9ZZZZ
MISPRISIPSIILGPGLLKYADPSTAYISPPYCFQNSDSLSKLNSSTVLFKSNPQTINTIISGEDAKACSHVISLDGASFSPKAGLPPAISIISGTQ